jgi:O-antigen/teichoic acid export membrane protein
MGRVQSLRVGVSAQMLPIVAGYGSNLLATPYVVVRLGLHDFGLWAVTGALAQFGALLDLGVTRSIHRFVALYHARGEERHERAIVGGSLTVILGVIVLLLCIPLAIPGVLADAIHADSPQQAQLLFLASIAILGASLLGAILSSASFGRGRMVAGNIGVTIQRAAVVLGGVIALIIRPDLELFAIGSVIGSLVGLLAIVATIWIDERELRVGLPSREVLPALLSFGLKGQAMGVLEIILFQSGKLIANAIIGPAAAGAYELGSRLALGARAVGATASVALTTHFTRQFATQGVEAIRKDYIHMTRNNTTFSIFVLFLLAATAPSAVPLWLGAPNHDVTIVVALLAIGFAVNVSTGVATATALAVDRIGLPLSAGVATSALALGLSIPFTYAFGIPGLSVGFIAAFVLGSALFLVILERATAIPFSDHLRAVASPFAVAIAGSVVAAPIGLIFAPHDRVSAILPFLVAVALFTATYLALARRAGLLDAWPRKIPRLGSRAARQPVESAGQPVE